MAAKAEEVVMQLVVKGRALASRLVAVSTIPAVSVALVALLGASSPASAGCGVVSHPTGVRTGVSEGVHNGVSSGTSTVTSLPSCGSTHTGPSTHVNAKGGAVAMIPKVHESVTRSEHTTQTITHADGGNSASHAGLTSKPHEKPKS
jgi:hypothetical protein